MPNGIACCFRFQLFDIIKIILWKITNFAILCNTIYFCKRTFFAQIVSQRGLPMSFLWENFFSIEITQTMRCVQVRMCVCAFVCCKRSGWPERAKNAIISARATSTLNNLARHGSILIFVFIIMDDNLRKLFNEWRGRSRGKRNKSSAVNQHSSAQLSAQWVMISWARTHSSWCLIFQWVRVFAYLNGVSFYHLPLAAASVRWSAVRVRGTQRGNYAYARVLWPTRGWHALFMSSMQLELCGSSGHL